MKKKKGKEASWGLKESKDPSTTKKNKRNPNLAC